MKKVFDAYNKQDVLVVDGTVENFRKKAGSLELRESNGSRYFVGNVKFPELANKSIPVIFNEKLVDVDDDNIVSHKIGTEHPFIVVKQTGDKGDYLVGRIYLEPMDNSSDETLSMFDEAFSKAEKAEAEATVEA